MRLGYFFLIAVFSLQGMNNQESSICFAGLDKHSCGIGAKIAGSLSLFFLHQLKNSYIDNQCASDPCAVYSVGAGAFIFTSAVLYYAHKKLPDTYTFYSTPTQDLVAQRLRQRERRKQILSADHSCKDIMNALAVLPSRAN